MQDSSVLKKRPRYCMNDIQCDDSKQPNNSQPSCVNYSTSMSNVHVGLRKSGVDRVRLRLGEEGIMVT